MRVVSDANTTVVLLLVGAGLVWGPEGSIPIPAWLVGWSHRLGNDRWLFVLIAQFVLEALFWGLALALHLGRARLEPYRLQPHCKAPELESNLTTEAMFSVVLGHWLVRPIGLYYLYPLAVLHGSLLGEDLPNPKVCCLQLLGCMLVDDTWFYWMHRGLHHFPWLYRTVHKKHHRFTRPNIFATEFAHPVEDLVVNMAGTVLGPILLGVHPLLLVGYMGMKFYQSLEAHSGYNIPFPFSLTSVIDSMDCAPAHDFHHSHNVGNFGGWFMFWDWLCGTDQRYREYLKKNSHSQVLQTAQRPYN